MAAAAEGGGGGVAGGGSYVMWPAIEPDADMISSLPYAQTWVHNSRLRFSRVEKGFRARIDSIL